MDHVHPGMDYKDLARFPVVFATNSPSEGGQRFQLVMEAGAGSGLVCEGGWGPSQATARGKEDAGCSGLGYRTASRLSARVRQPWATAWPEPRPHGTQKAERLWGVSRAGGTDRGPRFPPLPSASAALQPQPSVWGRPPCLLAEAGFSPARLPVTVAWTPQQGLDLCMKCQGLPTSRLHPH